MSRPWAGTPADILRDPSIPGGAKGLFGLLGTYADTNGRAWPSQVTLAAQMGMSESTIKRHLDTLLDAGILTWETKTTDRGRQRFYTLWRPGSDDLTPPGGFGSPDPTHQVRRADEQEPLDQEPLDLGERTLTVVAEAKSPSRPAKKATTYPEGFRPTPEHWALAQSLNVDLTAEGPQFADHHIAKASTFRDWDAALRKWIRNAAKFASASPAAAAYNKPGPTYLTAQQLANEQPPLDPAEYAAWFAARQARAQ